MQNYALSLLFTLLGLFSAVVQAAQVADKDFHPQVATPAFSKGSGPVVAVDAAHANFHTCEGRYIAFCELLGNDGYSVKTNNDPFSMEQDTKRLKEMACEENLGEVEIGRASCRERV